MLNKIASNNVNLDILKQEEQKFVCDYLDVDMADVVDRRIYTRPSNFKPIVQ